MTRSMRRVTRLAWPRPRGRKSCEFCAIVAVGYDEKSTRISCAMKKTRTACRYPSTSNEPSSPRNFVRLSDARLHAVSSRNMYSLHGLDALMRPVFGQVCHRLMVLSYCTPGSAQPHAASATVFQSSLALSVSTTSPVVRARVCHVPPERAERMNSSVTRIELFEFCPLTVWYASPLKSLA